MGSARGGGEGEKIAGTKMMGHKRLSPYGPNDKILYRASSWQGTQSPVRGEIPFNLKHFGGCKARHSRQTCSRSVVGGPRRAELAVDVRLDLTRVVFLVLGDLRRPPSAVLDLPIDKRNTRVCGEKNSKNRSVGWTVGRLDGRSVGWLIGGSMGGWVDS